MQWRQCVHGLTCTAILSSSVYWIEVNKTGINKTFYLIYKLNEKMYYYSIIIINLLFMLSQDLNFSK